MSGRLIAIGDIHGFTRSLNALLDAIAPTTDDTIVPLGDYIDRGPDSRGTIQRLIELSGQCRLIPILGNHDQMLLDIYDGRREIFPSWVSYGGNTTLASYDCAIPDQIPTEHIDFLRQCVLYHESNKHFFVHASYVPNLPLSEQPSLFLCWEPLTEDKPGPHSSGKTAIVGHTAQREGRILDRGHVICLDTRIYGSDGRLSAMDVQTGHVWQSDPEGNLREAEKNHG